MALFRRKKKGAGSKDIASLGETSVVTARAWFLLIVAGLICGAIALWVLFGNIPVIIKGNGILVSKSGLVSIRGEIAGTVTDLQVVTGQDIHKGDPLLKIYDPQVQVSLDQSWVLSPDEGHVLEVMVNVGDPVQPGSPLVWMEKKSLTVGREGSVVYAYFPIDTGKRISLKTPIEIVVPDVNSNKYGSILGKVVNLSRYVVSKETALHKIQNKAIVDQLIGENLAAVEVIIEPEMDPSHPGHFKWTSGIQPPYPISTGTLVTVEAVVDKVRPLYYLLPLPVFKTQRIED